MMSGKEIKFGVDGRAAMLRGVDLLADAVQVRFRKDTLGRMK
jgi:chaperonin GroEL (HSP60 family)